MTKQSNKILRAVAGFTPAPWEHALAALRLVGPIQGAGLQLIRGNLAEEIHPERVSQADLVVIQRDFPRHVEAYDQILALAHAEGKPVVLDLDDLLLELPDDHPDRATHYYAAALFPLLKALLEVDAITAASQPLCSYVQQFNPNVWILPNYLDDDLWKLKAPDEAKAETSPVVIGYMGGDSHRPDLEVVLPALLEILDRYGEQILLRFWGIQPPPALAGRANVEWVPAAIQNYAEFARFFQGQQADIWISPLADSLFNRSKSAIKFLEYSSQAIAGVYSRIVPYENIVTHGENGFLAGSPEEWVEPLSRLVEDPALRVQLGRRAQGTVAQDYLLSQNAHQWRQAYQQILAAGPRALSSSALPTELVLQLAGQAQKYERFLETRLQESEGKVQRQESELNAIHQSNGWVFLQRLLGVRRLLIPEGSQRERFLHALLKSLR